MSAANRWLNNRPLFGHMVTLIISLIVVFATYALNTNDLDDREFKNTLDNKADISYVDKKVDSSIKEHEKVDAARYKGISDMFTIIREEQMEMRRDIKEILKNQK